MTKYTLPQHYLTNHSYRQKTEDKHNSNEVKEFVHILLIFEEIYKN